MLKTINEAVKQTESIPLFRNPLLEKLSHVHPLVPAFLYLPVVGVSLGYSVYEGKIGLIAIGLSFFIGMFLWTWTEYTMHRFIFHPPFSDSYLRWLYYYSHGIHHEDPKDATRLVMPPAVSIPLAIGFYFLFQSLFGDYALSIYAGFVFAYLCYDYIHFATHFYRGKGAIFQYLKKHHLQHHYKDDTKNFGVSSPLWDFIFRTKLKKTS